MANNVLKFVALLAIFACLAEACRGPLQSCKKHGQCCSNNCQKNWPFRNGICAGIGKRSISDDDFAQEQNLDNEEHFVKEDDVAEISSQDELNSKDHCVPKGASCGQYYIPCCNGLCKPWKFGIWRCMT